MEIKKPIISLFFFLFSLPGFTNPTPPRSDDAIFHEFQKHFSSSTVEHFRRTIRRAGDRTIEFEAYLAVEADSKHYAQILSDSRGWANWLLNNINTRPQGGNYYCQIKELTPDAADPSLIHATLAMQFPLWKQLIQRDFKLSSVQDGQAFQIRLDALPSDKTPLEDLKAYMRVYPAKNSKQNVWIYARADIKIRNWLVYEALPERLLNRESGERVQIVLDNYQAEESRRQRSDRIKSPQK